MKTGGRALLCAALSALLLLSAAPRAAAESGHVDKWETVYVRSDALGEPESVTVEVELDRPGDGDHIRDLTDLTDIRNTRGDEEFLRQSKGVLLWEDHGQSIFYEGKSSRTLPVGLRVSYFLDGQPIDPEALAGRSGRVRIRFDYENNSVRSLTPDRESVREAGVCIPFLAVTLALLPEETFQNASAVNGRLLRTGEQTVFLGYGLPGLGEALSLGDYSLTEDVNLPNHAELEADVTEFSLAFTATIFTNGLLETLETDDLDELEDFAQGADALAKALEEMENGAWSLYDGSRTLQKYLRDYSAGVSKLKDGARTLAELAAAFDPAQAATPDYAGAAAALDGAESAAADCLSAAEGLRECADAQTAALNAAVAALDGADGPLRAALDATELTQEEKQAVLAAAAQGAGDARSALSGITVPSPAAAAGELERAAGALRDQAALCREALSQAAALESASRPAQLGALSQAASQLAQGLEALSKSGNALGKGARELTDGTQTFYTKIRDRDEDGEVSALTELGGDALQELLDSLRACREADMSFQSFSGLPEGCTGNVRFVFETAEIKG